MCKTFFFFLEALFSLDFKINCQWFIHHQLFPALFFLTLSKVDELFRVGAYSLYFHAAQSRSEEEPVTPHLLCADNLELNNLHLYQMDQSIKSFGGGKATFTFWLFDFSDDRKNLCSANHWKLETALTYCGQWISVRRRNKNLKTPRWSVHSGWVMRLEGLRTGVECYLAYKNPFTLCHRTSHEVQG